MKKTGAQLAAFALEQVGVKYTFGIPGTHNTELYDELNKSEKIQPILVTHEGGASFMADGVSRTSDTIGCLVIVPASGTAYAMCGMGEAFLDGVPMLVISIGTRTDTGREYQLHQIDQLVMTKGVTKAQFHIGNHEDIIPTMYKAYDIATSGEPGPVFIEIPVNVQMFEGAVTEMPAYQKQISNPSFHVSDIRRAADMLVKAEFPFLYFGWGTRNASEYTLKIAELLGAPVAVTIQGKSVFPNAHPLYTSAGMGAVAKPSGQWALKKHDVMLAVGVRFAEVATGSYGLENPKNLIHIDINSDVFNKNYKADLCIQADATEALKALYEELKGRNLDCKARKENNEAKILNLNEGYFSEWITGRREDIVSPGYFFQSLQKKITDDTIVMTDDGKHTFLTAELLNIAKPKHFVAPTDFNCMGYCVPAAIGAKLVNPGKRVVGIVGDGAMLMTGMEVITAATYGIAPLIFIFNDGELGQISEFQSIPLKYKTCTTLAKVNYEGFAIAAGLPFLQIDNDIHLDEIMDKAFELNDEGRAVIVNVKIDYSKKTMLTKGAVMVNLKRFPLSEKVRFIVRMAKRHTIG
jgi:acetolactate synthase-1/2/3 large subunit